MAKDEGLVRHQTTFVAPYIVEGTVARATGRPNKKSMQPNYETPPHNVILDCPSAPISPPKIGVCPLNFNTP